MTNKKEKIICDTLDEAKKEVLKRIQQGINYRDISQIEFLIDGRVKRFSIGESSKIKTESFEKINESKNRFKDPSFLFMLFDKRKHPTDIVIEYGLDPDHVQQVYKKYGEMKNMYLIPMSIKDEMYKVALRIGGSYPKDIEQAFSYVRETINWYFRDFDEEEELENNNQLSITS